MLKPINRVACSPALVACQKLMQRFALWLCDASTSNTDISKQGLQPPVLGSAIEANWLWDFLQRIDDRQSMLTDAQTVAAMPAAQKAELRTWIDTVTALAAQFQPGPTVWPTLRPIASESDWQAFKTLMQAFYKKALSSGLPYQPDGSPVAFGGVCYADFVKEFRDAHRLSPIEGAREVCVLCGGPLGDTPEVDHWIAESAFPLLSVCADNLLPICGGCNSTSNKGAKAVHSAGSFADWFHPYLRPGSGALKLVYSLPVLYVQCSASTPADQPKVDNLNTLLNLTNRWTREFKAEYAKHQGVLLEREKRRIKDGKASHTLQEVQQYIQEWQATLLPSEPHYEVHALLAHGLSVPERTQAWLDELSV